MAAKTHLSPSALPGQPYGAFADKETSLHGPHNPGTITRLVPSALPGRLYGNFAGKEPTDAPPAPEPVTEIPGGDGTNYRKRRKKTRIVRINGVRFVVDDETAERIVDRATPARVEKTGEGVAVDVAPADVEAFVALLHPPAVPKVIAAAPPPPPKPTFIAVPTEPDEDPDEEDVELLLMLA
jgi:hypothetical protein